MSNAINIRFDNKTALVTGAGQGIGRAVAEKLLALGAKVIAVSLSHGGLETLKSAHPDMITIQCDLGNWKETQDKLKPHTDNVDLLVNNAATSGAFPVGEIEEKDIDRMFNVNYKAVINITQMVLEGMKKRNSGSIVNVSSISAYCAWNDHCVYGSTKAALDMVTWSVTGEFGKYNIRVNSVNPTVVWTELGKSFWSDEAKNKPLKAMIPQNRFVEVHEVVDPICFLLSDYASMINGVRLTIDGGLTAKR